MSNYSRYEQETIINFNEEESTAQVYTFNRSLQTKLRKLSEERPEECRIDPDERRTCGGAAAAYIVPKSWVKVAPPRKVTMTEEQVEAARERMREARKAKRTV
nr:hypothetical protein [Clostridia bacterium]